ncbi:hypothetical protein [Staphylococcus saprophyticus]|uniref:hypothetical protein n=1 Tax=Staphylococcus saprophyticus TaxID=29385 RepID=UPI0021B5D4C6|nr:hypothetical protein [Staphylococcus saprophyticus]
MKKLLLPLTITGVLLLGACGNDEAEKKEETKKEQASKLSDEEQEKKYKEETKKLGKILAEAGEGISEDISDEASDDSDISEEDFKALKKEVNKYRDNTKHLDKVNTEIGDYAYKTAYSMLLYAERTYELENFKKNNPDLEDAYDLANIDAVYTLLTVFETIQMDYEDFDIDYKKEYLGAKGNEGVTDILALQEEANTMDLADGLGVAISEFQDDLNSNQNKELSNKEYRDKISKNLIHEEPDMSKREYNSIVQDYNEVAPKFLQYDEVNKMVSTTEYNYMMDLRNGVVDTDSSSEVDDFGSSESDDSGSSSSDEPVTRENVIDKVEEYEGEPLDTETYSYKEPEKTDDGDWGFSFTDENGDLAGSYIVDEDGIVTKYDEDGEEE